MAQGNIKRFQQAQTFFKVLPFLTATLYAVITLVGCYCEGWWLMIFDALFGSSVLFIAVVFYINYVFKLCIYHRLMLLYPLIIDGVYIGDALLCTNLRADLYVDIVVGLYGLFSLFYAIAMLCRK